MFYGFYNGSNELFFVYNGHNSELHTLKIVLNVLRSNKRFRPGDDSEFR